MVTVANPAWEKFNRQIGHEMVLAQVLISRSEPGYEVRHVADRPVPPQELSSLEEVEHLLSRVIARPVVPLDALTKGARYDAGVRLGLDVSQLPKPFQINALASREWSLQSEWYRWSYSP